MEISQSQSKNTARSHLYEVSQIVQLTATEAEWWVVARGWGKGRERELLFNRYKVSVIQDK